MDREHLLKEEKRLIYLILMWGFAFTVNIVPISFAVLVNQINIKCMICSVVSYIFMFIRYREYKELSELLNNPTLAELLVKE